MTYGGFSLTSSSSYSLFQERVKTSSGEMMSLKLSRSSWSGKTISHVFGRFSSLMSARRKLMSQWIADFLNQFPFSGMHETCLVEIWKPKCSYLLLFFFYGQNVGCKWYWRHPSRAVQWFLLKCWGDPTPVVIFSLSLWGLSNCNGCPAVFPIFCFE